MGHDISAYLGSSDPADPLEQLDGWGDLPEVAYLRRGSSNAYRHTLYEVLDAQEYDGDVSGVWAARWFNREELQAGLVRLQQLFAEGQEVQPEVDFVQACLDALPLNRTSVFVTFG
jgi:hypothetical protein